MFDPLLTEIGDRDRRFTVYRSGEGTEIEDQFAAHDVSVTRRSIPPDGPDPFLVIEEEGEFAGALGLSELEALIEPPIVRPGERDDVSAGYRVLFDVLDETVFSAMNRRQLLAVSREVEDRAYRVGTGTLHASFQTLSTFESQVDVYRQLAASTELDIHIHGIPNWAPPEIAGISYHEYDDDTDGRYWALAFDGGSNESQACGLVAREQTGRYEGFWTDDTDLVEEMGLIFTGGSPSRV